MPWQPDIPPIRPSDPFPWLSWRYSLIFPVALIALLGSVAIAVFTGNDSPSPDVTPAPTETSLSQTAPTVEGSSLEGASSTPSGVMRSTEPAASQAPASPVRSAVVEGIITDASGEPVQGAVVANGSEFSVTGDDGLYSISLPAGGGSLGVMAPGYLKWAETVTDAESRLDISLERQQINGLYFNPNFSNNEEDIQRYIDMVNTTSANAVVIDIKEEIIYFDSKVQLFVDAGTVRPSMDLAALIKRFQDEGIYTIARLVVFKDGLVAQYAPYLAVLNNQTGDLWRDDNGVAWVNPMVHDLWDANIELAVEAAGYGFDEIQYDYVRFPTDGDFTTMEFGLPNTQENREKSINTFLEESRAALAPLGVRQSADVFGYTLLVDDDLGIGQNFPEIAERVDYISPMIYPSHWPEGSLDVPGHPNSFPYETIEISMMQASEKLGGDMRKVRPWLQDFNFPGLIDYGDKEVGLQIEATEAYGASGWLMWDPDNAYHPGGFGGSTDGSTPVALLPGTLVERHRVTVRSAERQKRAGAG